MAFSVNAQINKSLDSLFTNLYKEGKFQGNVLIIKEHKIIFQKSMGFTDWSAQKPLNKNTIFEIASISKQFTAMAIMQLKAQGLIHENDDIGKYIPELSFYKGLKISHLLSHTNGLPDYIHLIDSMYRKKDWPENREIATNTDVVSMLAEQKLPLSFEPGAAWEYGDTGFVLLAFIVEKLSRKSYHDYLAENIFKPLKMSRSLVYTRRYKPVKIKNYAYGHTYSDSLKRLAKAEEIPHEESFLKLIDGIMGDGGVNLSAPDLLKWCQALTSYKLLEKDKVAIMFQKGKLNNGENFDYGFGIGIENHSKLGTIWSHNGYWAGSIARQEIHVDAGLIIIMLQNKHDDKSLVPVEEVRGILQK
jgi:CubicO group peptidase (beta-lactamase class C family)